MGNASGREVGNGHAAASPEQMAPGGSGSSAPADVVMWEPPPPPPAPYVFAPQVPVAPPPQIPTGFFPVFGHSPVNGSDRSTNNNNPREKGIPSSITWRHGGNKVFVEGSWDNWTSRKLLRRSGRVRAILLVLPSGIYHYRIIVDGVPTFDFELPYVTDEIGQVANILDVNDNDLDNLESLAEFDAPPSPEHSYGQQFPADDEFYKEPPALPPQLPMSIPAGGRSDDEHAPMLKPKHVVIDHMFMEEGWKSQSVCALAVTHRFGPKYVNFTLYKPLPRGDGMGAGSSGGLVELMPANKSASVSSQCTYRSPSSLIDAAHAPASSLCVFPFLIFQ